MTSIFNMWDYEELDERKYDEPLLYDPNEDIKFSDQEELERYEDTYKLLGLSRRDFL